LCGYTPFDRDSPEEEARAIMRGDYKFEPPEYWANVSETARDFVRTCLTVDPKHRPTAEQMLKHKWLADLKPHFVPDPNSATGEPMDLLPQVRKQFDARRTFRRAILSVAAARRFSVGPKLDSPKAQLAETVKEYKKAAEEEHIGDDDSITYAHDASPATSPNPGSSSGQLQTQQLSAFLAPTSTPTATATKTYAPPPGPPPASTHSAQGSDTGSKTNADDLQKAFARQSLTEH